MLSSQTPRFKGAKMLILSRKVDEKIKIGTDITITLIGISGDQVKIGVEAPKSIKVFRQEVFDDIQKQNKTAAETSSIEAISRILSN